MAMRRSSLKKFQFQHKSDDLESDHLVKRVTDGLYSSKYKHVDYDQLRAITAEKKMIGYEKLMKVKKIKEASKQGKEMTLLKQHKMVWQKEFNHLNSTRKRLQSEIDSLIRQNIEDGLTEQMFSDFYDYGYDLHEGFQTFKKQTVDPMWTLREDLQYWLYEHQTVLNEEQTKQDHQEVMKMVESVKKQQAHILQQLHHEQLVLDAELQCGELPVQSLTGHDKKVQTGIPEDVFDLACPDFELKSAVLSEFIHLDTKYCEKLEELKEQHLGALTSKTGNWSEEENYLFMIILEQYTHDIPDRRMLYIDRMKRHFPQKTRAQIVAHEEWWTQYKYHNERQKALINDWLRDRQELTNKTILVFEEACALQAHAELRDEQIQKQKEVCSDLYQKVKVWREHKIEALYLEQALAERKKEDLVNQMKIEKEKDKKRRDSEKQKIKTFHSAQEARRHEIEEREKQRLEELKKILADEAAYDEERVKFRHEQLLMKEEERHKREQEKLIEEEEKERILDRLRETVRPIVDTDPLRVMNETEAWHARKQNDEEFINIQKPLFNVHTFKSDQITTDPRVKLETRLREAGVMNTDYARHMIMQMKPIQPPRRDMKSSVFSDLKND